MKIENIFTTEGCNAIIQRIEKLKSDSAPLWGSMNVAQMLAHCNVTYELIYENKHPKPSGFNKLMLKLFVKSFIVNEKQYGKNLRTAPAFLVASVQDFENEKKRLIDYIQLTCKNGVSFFEGKESHSFGKLNSKEWNNMMAKHLDHHLSQFGV